MQLVSFFSLSLQSYRKSEQKLEIKDLNKQLEKVITLNTTNIEEYLFALVSNID